MSSSATLSLMVLLLSCTFREATLVFELSESIFDSLFLDLLNVEAAHIAGASVVNIDKVAEFFVEKLVNHFVIRNRSTFSAKLQSRNFAFSALKSQSKII